MSTPPSAPLDELAAAFTALASPASSPAVLAQQIRTTVERRARDAGCSSEAATALVVASDLLVELVRQRGRADVDLEPLLHPIAQATSISVEGVRLIVFMLATQAIALGDRISWSGVLDEARLLRLCAPVEGVAVLRTTPEEVTEAIAAVDLDHTEEAVRIAIRRIVEVGRDPDGTGALRAIRLGTLRRPALVLVVRARNGAEDQALGMAATSGTAIARIVDRAAAAEERSSVSSKLRDAFHDGPLQSLALLRGSARALHDRLAETVDETESRSKLGGPIDDLIALADSAEAELRTISRNLEARIDRDP